MVDCAVNVSAVLLFSEDDKVGRGQQEKPQAGRKDKEARVASKSCPKSRAARCRQKTDDRRRSSSGHYCGRARACCVSACRGSGGCPCLLERRRLSALNIKTDLVHGFHLFFCPPLQAYSLQTYLAYLYSLSYSLLQSLLLVLCLPNFCALFGGWEGGIFVR